MSARPKLGYLVPGFPGQTHTNVWSEAAAMEERGVDVVIWSTRPPVAALCPHDWGRIAMERTRWLEPASLGERLRGLAALPAAEILGREAGLTRALLAAAGPAARLAHEARALGVTHLHVQGAGQGALIAALAARIGGPAWSIALSGPLSEGGPGQNFKWRGARFATAATERILNELRFVLRDDLPRRVSVQPAGIDTGFFRRAEDDSYRPWREGQDLMLVASGRIAAAKGFDDLLRAMRLLLDRGYPARLTIAGEDDAGGAGHRQTLAALAAQLRLGPHVALPGAVDAGELRRLLLSAHVFVLPAWQEPLGTALMEAMACGVPSIGTAAGGVRELIQDGRDGILVPPRTPEALAGAILRIAGNRELAQFLSIYGRARIVNGFDAAIGADHLLREVGFLPIAAEDLLSDPPPALHG